MGRDANLNGFLLGAIVGYAASNVFFHYYCNSRAHRNGEGKDKQCSAAGEQDIHFNGSSVDRTSTTDQVPLEKRRFSESSHEPKKDEASSNRSAESKSRSMSSVSRQSYTIDEDEELVLPTQNSYSKNRTSGTNRIITHDEWAEDAEVNRLEKAFDEEILSKIKSEQDMRMILRRSNAVNALAQALAEAEDEKGCFEVVSRMIVPLFQIDAFCYGLVKDSETIIFKHATANSTKFLEQFFRETDENGSIEQPISMTAAAVCSKTLEQIYVPRTGESSFPAQRIVHRIGYNSQLVTPIVVNGNKFAGTMNAYMEREDGLSEVDMLLLKDVANMLGASIITHDEWAEDDEVKRLAKAFDEEILSKVESEQDMKMILRRSGAVNALAQALAEAEDEKACFEVVSRMIVPLFQIDAFCYGLVKDSETIIYKHATSNSAKFLKQIGLEMDENGSIEQPISATAAAVCSKTLEQMYAPRTGESSFPAQRIVHRIGYNSQLVTPIVVYGNKFAGTMNAFMEREDAFSEVDTLLLKDVANMLGASIYNKRLKFASECSKKVAKEMLHSMIPPKVIKKIECYWDETSYEYQSRRRSSNLDQECSSDNDSDNLDNDDEFFSLLGVESFEYNTDGKLPSMRPQRRQSITNKINLLNEMSKSDPDCSEPIPLDASVTGLETTHNALYAETVPNTCIIFTDVVDFANISHYTKPIRVMDMLQGLFSRFDALCELHGIQKLETIGDMFICTTSMFDNDSIQTDAQAANALNLAKEMIKEARKVRVPISSRDQTLDIRVGIHRGDLTCGVLGERLPKFTVYGSSVNMAARMKETCPPNMIRATKALYECLPNEQWHEKEVISVKNMGDVETYLLNPFVVE